MIQVIINRIRPLKKRSFSLDNIKLFIDRMEETALANASTLAQDIQTLKEMAVEFYGEEIQTQNKNNELHRTMFDMPVNMAEATVQLALRKVTNKRIRQGWYKDKYIFLINSEKSSSTLHEIVIRGILECHSDIAFTPGIQRGIKFGPTELASGSTIHGLLPMYAPDGGLFRGPYLPMPGNFRYIEDLGNCKIVFLCRHPADRLVASGCMLGSPEEAEAFEKRMNDGIAFRGLIHEYFSKFLKSLHNDLNWMAGWLLKYNGRDNFRVFRYEDMVAAPKMHFAALFRYLTGKDMDEESWEMIQDKMPKTKAGGELQPGNTALRNYPRGYTGNVGIWKNYLSDKDIADYNDIVSRFLNYHPGAPAVLELFPDLLLAREN